LAGTLDLFVGMAMIVIVIVIVIVISMRVTRVGNWLDGMRAAGAAMLMLVLMSAVLVVAASLARSVNGVAHGIRP